MHSDNDLNKLNNKINTFTIKTCQNEAVKGIEGVPFQLSEIFSTVVKKNVIFFFFV